MPRGWCCGGVCARPVFVSTESAWSHRGIFLGGVGVNLGVACVVWLRPGRATLTCLTRPYIHTCMNARQQGACALGSTGWR